MAEEAILVQNAGADQAVKQLQSELDLLKSKSELTSRLENSKPSLTQSKRQKAREKLFPCLHFFLSIIYRLI